MMQASKTAVLNLKAPRILQFFTHGYYLPASEINQVIEDTQIGMQPSDAAPIGANPLLRSMLIMAGANIRNEHPVCFFRSPTTGQIIDEEQAKQQIQEDHLEECRLPPDNGLLTAYEVATMDLHGTELVNLTACQTGVGDIGEGEGILGLRAAFMIAGSRALTASLWSVPTVETSKEFTYFYQGFLKNKDNKEPYKSFYAAQMQSLSDARDRHQSGHPFYWAGFVYVGDPGDLPTGPNPSSAAAGR